MTSQQVELLFDILLAELRKMSDLVDIVSARNYRRREISYLDPNYLRSFGFHDGGVYASHHKLDDTIECLGEIVVNPKKKKTLTGFIMRNPTESEGAPTIRGEVWGLVPVSKYDIQDRIERNPSIGQPVGSTKYLDTFPLTYDQTVRVIPVRGKRVIHRVLVTGHPYVSKEGPIYLL